jgi:hypothetical protein
MFDDSSAAVTMPFAWRFYGAPTTQLIVSSNGFVNFGGGIATEYNNAPIPDEAEPNGFIAPFWDDLFPGAGGAVRAATLGTWPTREFIVSWDGVPHIGVSGSTLSFQVVLEEATGDAILNYLDVLTGDVGYDRGASATVGVESPSGASGTTVSYNSPWLEDATALRCTTQPLSVSLTPSVASPGTIGGAVRFTASASGGAGQYQYRYFLSVPGGGQTLARDYSTVPTWDWNTSGLAPGTYAVVVHARNAGSSKSYETYRALGYRLAAPASAVTLTSSVASPGTIGGRVGFTAAATGGSGQYQYRYYLGVAGGSQSLVRDYSTIATWNWNTTDFAAGTYTVIVHARNVGSARSYDTYKAISYRLATPAAAVTLTPGVASPGTSGGVVTFNAVASGGSGQYQYRYYLGAPGRGQSLVRDYSTVANWSWNTGGLAPGTYTVIVHARNVGSTRGYETYKALSYRLSMPASAVTLTPSVASPARVGGTVTFTAAASGGSGQYQYRYYLGVPSGAQTLVRDYSTVATWSWNTAGRAPGTYTVVVHARNVGSTRSYDTFAALNYGVR